MLRKRFTVDLITLPSLWAGMMIMKRLDGERPRMLGLDGDRIAPTASNNKYPRGNNSRASNISEIVIKSFVHIFGLRLAF
jgi:hypothetical protein